MPTARMWLATAVVNGKIYAIGGCGLSSGLQVVEVYDPKVDIWTAKSEMLTKRLGHSASVVDGKIYVIGGQICYDRMPLAISEEYDPKIKPRQLLR